MHAIEMLTLIIQGTAWDGSDLSVDASRFVIILVLAVAILCYDFINLNIYL